MNFSKTSDDPPIFDEVSGALLDRVHKKKLQPIEAIATMLPSWNACCRDEGGGVGLARGWHICLGGNTGTGKSLVALNLAAHAVKNGEKVGLVSLEMSQMQTVTRFMSIFSGVPVTQLEHGRHYNEDSAYQVKALLDENKERNGGVLLTNEKPIDNLKDILDSILYLHEYVGCRMFVTDYLQLAWTGNAQNINDRITEVSHSIRGLVVDLGVVSIGISQFNRSTSSQKERPVPQGLMGGSALENDANQVVLLDHSSFKKQGNHGAIMKLLLCKNRHGATGDINCRWDYGNLTFNELAAGAEIEDSDGRWKEGQLPL